jgi:RNA polymerase sigma-70 factor (ECF subfamily)
MGTAERQLILDEARQGNQEALGAFLESFRPYLRCLLRGFPGQRVQGRIDTSDLVQDAFVEAFRSFSTFRGTTVGEFVAWLDQVAVRTAGRSLRGQKNTLKRELTREEALDDLNDLPGRSGSTPSAKAMRNEQKVRVMEALDQLPPDMQQVLLARHMEDLSHAEIAQRLGRNEVAVRVLYVRAVRRFREYYKPD